MIVGIRGKVIHKEPTSVHMDVNGIIYNIFISLNCSKEISDSNIKLFTTYIVKEDSQSLYGFLNLNEKILFDTVIKVNGVGPKVALAICSTFTPEDFVAIIASKDIASLKKVPGIGPKGASRIFLELNDFIVQNNIPTGSQKALNEANLALESLGFKKDQIRKVLSNCKSKDTAGLVKEALRGLQR